MKILSDYKIMTGLLLVMCFLNLLPVYGQKMEKFFDMHIEDLMKIKVVTASKTTQKLSDVPATVRIITSEQIQERGYFTLEEALSDLPGFQFRNIVGFNSYVFMRGMPAQNQATLLLVDGVQINELNSGGFYAGGHFNLSNVKKIEVVYGPASALYGTNALSGIINIITNDPKDIQGGEISILQGNFGTANYDLTYGHYNQDYDLGIRISGMFKQSEKANLREGNGDFNWTDQMENFEDDYAFDGKITYKNLSLGMVFQDKLASRTTNYKTVDADYLDHGTRWHIRFFNGYMKYLYNTSSRWSNQTTFYYRNATVMDNTIAYITSDTSATGGQTGYYRPNDLLGFENQLDSKILNSWNIIAGFVFEKENLSESFSKTYSGSPDIKPPIPPRPVMITNELTSLYLISQHRFSKYIQLTLGYRYDKSNYYGSVNTPRLGLVFNKNKLTAKFLYMEAFRAPKPWDYTYGNGNPDLKPEIMKSFEITTSYVFSDNIMANLSVYRNHIKGKFIREEQRQINGPRLNTTGAEIELITQYKKYAASLNYTYNTSLWEHGDQSPEIGKHNANFGVLCRLTNHIKFDIRTHYLGNRKNVKTITTTGSDYIDDAFIVSSTLSFLNMKGFNFQLICKNIFDAEYYHTSNNPPDRYRQPQRTWMLKAGFRF